MNAERASVIGRLEAFKVRFDVLLELLQGPLPPQGQAKSHAQTLLTSLKGDLGGVYRDMSSVRGEAALNDTERAYYSSAIHQDFTDVQVATNSIPNEKWQSELYCARISIIHAIDLLRRDSQ